MILPWAILAASLLALLAYLLARTRPRQRETGSVVLAPELMPRGRVTIEGDVILRAQSRTRGPQAEIDVPTKEVDRILGALQTAGFSVRDTGMTVDTDEGEETLTTIAMDLEGQAQPASHPEDILTVTGDLTAEHGVRLACNLHVKGTATLHEQVLAVGNIEAVGSIYVGAGTQVRGTLRSGRDIHMGSRATATALVAARDVHLQDLRPETEQRVQARRVHVAQTR